MPNSEAKAMAAQIPSVSLDIVLNRAFMYTRKSELRTVNVVDWGLSVLAWRITTNKELLIAMNQREVVTIHGISSDGQWQEMIEYVLGPNFKCTSLKYPYYRRLGALKLIVHPPTLTVGLGVYLAVLYFFPASSPCLAWGLLTAVVGISHLASHVLRRKAVDHVDGLFVRSQGFRPPHFIGHSLGTYLCGVLLLRSEDLAFHRVILTGCVLPVDYPWRALISGGRKACKEVRNEVGRFDIVAWVAFFLHGWLGSFGRAGYSGFSSKDGIVHSLDGPYQACDQCSSGKRVLVHNVSHPQVGHSDLFITPKYCDRFWLPFLIGIEPQEYRDFGDYCIEASVLEHEDPAEELPLIVRAFFEERWKWAGGTVADALRRRILKLAGRRFSPFELERTLNAALRLTWRLYAAARLLQCERLRGYLCQNCRGSLWDDFLRHVGIDDQFPILDLSSGAPEPEQDVVLRDLDLYRLLDHACTAALAEAITKHGLSDPARSK